MQKQLINEDIKRLLIRYYKHLKNSEISDNKREKRLKKIKSSMAKFSKADISSTAHKLSKSRNRPYIFKVWCEIVVLTGEV